jgi:type VI secretion system protein ImpK
VDLAADWFSTILALRHVRELPEAEALRHRMLTLKKQFESAATEGGFNPEDIEASQLALIALLDETVFSGRGKGSEAWRRTPLTEVVYGHHLGGEEFYNHLEKLRAQPEAHAAALELFAFCLALGFKGRLAGTDELAQVRHQVLEQVARLRRGAAPPLAPNFEWHQDLPDIEKDWFRWWMPPVGAVIAMILTWAIVKFIAVAEAREIANEIVQRVGR